MITLFSQHKVGYSCFGFWLHIKINKYILLHLYKCVYRGTYIVDAHFHDVLDCDIEKGGQGKDQFIKAFWHQKVNYIEFLRASSEFKISFWYCYDAYECAILGHSFMNTLQGIKKELKSRKYN